MYPIWYNYSIAQFLSTLSLRRATMPAVHVQLSIKYFYPRSPCGERHEFATLLVNPNMISIHALLAESDQLQ